MAAAAISAACGAMLHGTMLEEREGVWGRLDSLALEGGSIIAEIGGRLIELPAQHSDLLRSLCGERVVVGLFGGKYRIGRCSS